MSAEVGDREVTVLGIAVEDSDGPLLVLRERGGARRALPIRIGLAEATELALAVAEEITRRPLTHQLLVDVIAAAHQRVTRVRIGGLAGGVFYAELVLASGARIDARPSDAVAVALAADATIHIADAVLAAAAVPLADIAGGAFAHLDPDPPPHHTETDAEIEAQTGQLRSWLNTATAENFTPDPSPDDDH